MVIFEQKEVEFGILDLFFKINVSRPEVTRIVVKTNDDNEIILPETQQYLVYIENKDGTKIRLYDSVMVFKKNLHTQKPFEMVLKSYDFTDHRLFFNGNYQKIKSITYTGLLTIINKDHQKTFSLVDKVWMIMNQIFEQKTFLITQLGIVVNKEDLS